MNKFLTLTAFTLTLAGCAVEGPRGPAGEVVTVSPPVVSEIESLVAEENDWRVSQGLSVLSKGLSCKLHTITGGNRIQSSSGGWTQITGVSQVASYTYIGEFNQPNSSVSTGLNVLPESIRNIYTNMFMLRCEGFIVITSNGHYSFSLTSDDASLLYINGSKVIDNDNAHGAVTVTGQKLLRKGVHTFKLEFAQTGGGNQALILKSGSNLISREVFYK